MCGPRKDKYILSTFKTNFIYTFCFKAGVRKGFADKLCLTRSFMLATINYSKSVIQQPKERGEFLESLRTYLHIEWSVPHIM